MVPRGRRRVEERVAVERQERQEILDVHVPGTVLIGRGHPRDLVHHPDVRGHAEARHLLLDDRGDDAEDALLVVGHQLERERFLRAVSRLGQQRLRPGRVVGAQVVDVHGVEGARRDDADPRGRLTLERDLHDLLAIDAVAPDRLAHPDIAEDRVGRAVLGHGLAVSRHRDLHQRHHGRGLFPGHDLRLRTLRLHGVDVLRREGGDEVDLPRLERGHLGEGILDHADDHAVEIRAPRLEVLVEAVHHQVTALHPLDQPERSASRHRFRLALLPVLETVLLRRDRVVDHEPGAVAGEHVQEKRVGMLQADLHGERIDDLGAPDRVVERPHARLGFRISEPVDAELDGRGIEPGAVVEEHVLLELERVEEAVGRHLPRLRRVGDELPVRRDVEEAAADVHRDPHHFVARRGVEIEVGDLVAVRDPQRAAALRLVSGQRGAGHEEEEDTENRGRPHHLSSQTFL